MWWYLTVSESNKRYSGNVWTWLGRLIARSITRISKAWQDKREQDQLAINKHIELILWYIASTDVNDCLFSRGSYLFKVIRRDFNKNFSSSEAVFWSNSSHVKMTHCTKSNRIVARDFPDIFIRYNYLGEQVILRRGVCIRLMKTAGNCHHLRGKAAIH